MDDAKKVIRLGFAGLGFGARVQLPVLQSFPGVIVAAIAANKQVDKARALASNFGISKVCKDITELLNENVDGFVFALPPKAGVSGCREAFKLGKPVLTEKPIATTMAEANELLQLSQGLNCAVDFEFGEIPAFQMLKKIISGGKLGAVKAITINWLYQSYAELHRHWSWKTSGKDAGGVVTLIGTHVFYLLEWLVGRSKWAASSTLSNEYTKSFTPPNETAAEDIASITMSGKVPMVQILLSNSLGGHNLHRWEFFCERGIVILENNSTDQVHGFSLRIFREDGVEELIYDDQNDKDHDGRQDAFRLIASRFIDSLRNGSENHPNFSDGYRVQQLIDAVFESAREQKVIQIAAQ